MEKVKTLIVGGGAAGLFLAAAMKTENVRIVEKGERLGKKLSATGNGQGNLTNEGVSASRYFNVGARTSALSLALERYGKDSLCAFMNELGAIVLPDGRGRYYPTGKQASAITDLLRYRLEKKGVSVQTGGVVTRLKKQGVGFIATMKTPSGEEELYAENVVLAVGGKAAKNFGTDGSAYALARSFGHTVTELYPSLVQLKTDVAPIKTLRGIRVDAAVTAYDGKGNRLGAERGDVIFTEYGVSGDAIFRLSAFVADKLEQGVTLSLAFLPDVDGETLLSALRIKQIDGAIPESELLCGILNNQVGRSVLKSRKNGSLESTVSAMKDFRLTVKGSLGFDYAQVTKGGVPLEEVTEELESKYAKGLYFAGEVLDVDGECGGFNLQWAYSSARVVAAAIDRKEA